MIDMFQDIFLFIGLPATISAMNVLFNKNYWDIAGISWFIVGILKIYPINPLIGIVVIVSGICQYVYGYLKDKEKKKLLPIKEKSNLTSQRFEDQLKASLNSLKNNK